MLRDIFNSAGVYSFGAIPAADARIIKPYLLKDAPDGCHAVFALIPYYTGKSGNLAAFAAVPDYHRFAAELLSAAARYIADKYGVYAKGFADHSPFDEVHGASVTGLGMIGDSGLLISREYSSFVCICELVTVLTEDQLTAEGIPVIRDGAVTECEHCGRCKAACPTGALALGKHICLSAITQKKCELTPDEAELVRRGRYAWGCDECQQACPHTAEMIRRGTVTPIEYFHRHHIDKLTPARLGEMTDEEYARYTFSWRRREIMERNLMLKGEHDD